MEEIEKRSAAKASLISHKDVVGMKVLSKTGKDLGKVKDLHLHKTSLRIEGIHMDAGFFEEDTYIGRGYIQRIGDEGVILAIDPLTEVLGKKVFDVEGRRVGKVKEILREGKTNELVSLVVDRGMGSDDLIIARNAIDAIGENIVLRQRVEA